MLPRWAVAALLAAGTVLLTAGPVRSLADQDEHIASYDVQLDIRADGSLEVRESIGYDFGSQERHGILRTIPVRLPFDNDHDRVYEIDEFRVTSPTGAPTEVERSEGGGIASYRIGDPDTTVTGLQAYTVEYVVRGALNAFEDHDELYWNAIGNDWDVRVERPTVTVRAPAAITAQACFAGPTGSSLPCEALGQGQGPDAETMTAGQPAGLKAHQALTVVVGLPKGAVTSTGPVLEERWTLRRALTPTPMTGSLATLLLVPGLAAIGWLVGTRGRDRRYAGLTPGIVDPTSAAREEPVPLAGAGAVAVQFTPPEGLRPGQVGTLLDERANPLDVTATIVDLAVRGHLRIEELPRRGWFSSRDWRLVRLPGGEGQLRPYEQLLYDGLFETGDEVLLSSLKKQFAARLQKVQSALYDEVTAAGWFRGRPDKVRGRWQAGGFVLAFGGGWLTFALSRQLHWAPVGIAVMLVGATLFLVGRRMPARTARGSAVLVQARGFREYIRTAEAEQLRFEEGQDIFSRYLPYAVVFGEAERWVRVFGPLAAASAGATAVGPTWYAGPDGWDADSFGDSLDGFTSSAAGTLSASTASSSGGSG
ncbi:MAG: DUF2207 domain-containing protein, partial [Sporichthyaceae bacterium]|nr:DUF2207 domain-containing protein [Sporichthyaceae bacterium]